MKNYWVTFGTQDPRTYTGLSPSFILYFNHLGATQAPPGITEVFAGSGYYRFQASVGWSQSVAFLVDGGASATTARYVRGNLDSADALDLTVGYTASAISDGSVLGQVATVNAVIGTTASSFGSTSVNPGDIFGVVKRLQENLEGNATFLKSSGTWSIFSRGSSTLLTTKTLTQSTTGVTKL